MAEVIWTDNAIADLNDIGEYIAKESIRYAELTITKLFAAPDILEEYPRKGSIVPQFMDETIRQLMVGSYRIVYQLVGENRINILTVHHGKRLISNTRHFKKKKEYQINLCSTAIFTNTAVFLAPSFNSRFFR